MASKTASSFFFISLLVFLSIIPNSSIAATKITAVFAFGDSTIDAGNNNHLNCLFRCDHLPYGCDFPNQVPTGRFSNGKISTDYVSEFLGIKEFLPAFLDPQVTDDDLLTGVSFGSGGAGLDNHTVAFDKALDLDSQFELFEQALLRIRKNVGDEKANDIINNALFVISIGTNDMLYNVYVVPVPTSTSATPYGSISSYQDVLLQNLHNFVQRLYGAGGRRIMVAGLPPMGCIPLLVTLGNMLPSQQWLQRVCNVEQNIDSKNYNTKLQSYVQLLQATLPGAKVAYFDIYTPILDMVLYPTKYGFGGHSLQGCCGTGMLEMASVCNAADIICPDPSKYLFWDSVHLTQQGYSILAKSGQQTLLPYLTS